MFGEFVEKVVAEGLTDAFEKFDVDVLPLKDAIAIWARTIYMVRKPFDSKVLAVEFRSDKPSEMEIRFSSVGVCHFGDILVGLDTIFRYAHKKSVQPFRL